MSGDEFDIFIIHNGP